MVHFVYAVAAVRVAVRFAIREMVLKTILCVALSAGISDLPMVCTRRITIQILTQKTARKQTRGDFPRTLVQCS